MNYKHTILIAIVLAFSSCRDYLAVTPDRALTVPTKLEDLQALLEQEMMFEYSPAETVLGADNYYLEYATWQSWYIFYRHCYIWLPDVNKGTTEGYLDWGDLYTIVYNTNVVLDGLRNLSMLQEDRDRYHLAKGMALFYRAFSFFGLAQVYALPYSEVNVSKPGIPLRLRPDLDKAVQRATIGATYGQIINDLKTAAQILPDQVQVNHLNWPSKPSAYAALARVYLAMRKYHKAGLYADSSLQLHASLLDYNTIDSGARYPFPKDNPELLLQAYINTGIGAISTWSTTRLVDSLLYRSYSTNDLRRSLYFADNDKGQPYYRGSYSANSNSFGGFATDEMYLTRAECAVRNSDIQAALNDLNTLLLSRWKAGTYVPYRETNPERLLEIILRERRKELVSRGLRWTDLRRLNQEKSHQSTLKRQLKGEVYTLPPNDPRYVYPIPEEELHINPLVQNQR